MSDEMSQTTRLVEQWISKLQGGDIHARERLVTVACDRLLRLVRMIKRGYPQVERWEQTEDILQNVLYKLHRSLARVQPTDAKHFYRLAALHIRRELIDMVRHYHGPHGWAANHQSRARRKCDDTGGAEIVDAAEITQDPRSLIQWTTFHEAVERLPDELREVFDLIWYNELPQQEVAALMQVDVRTVKRRWRAARLQLRERLGEGPCGR